MRWSTYLAGYFNHNAQERGVGDPPADAALSYDDIIARASRVASTHDTLAAELAGLPADDIAVAGAVLVDRQARIQLAYGHLLRAPGPRANDWYGLRLRQVTPTQRI